MEDLNIRKTFKDVKRGDTIYVVMVSNGKVKIFKKIVDTLQVEPNGVCASVKVKDGTWGIWYSHLKAYCTKGVPAYSINYTHVCTTLDEAKLICIEVATDIIKKAKKEMANVQDRINRWEANLAALRTNNFILR